MTVTVVVGDGMAREALGTAPPRRSARRRSANGEVGATEGIARSRGQPPSREIGGTEFQEESKIVLLPHPRMSG
jgi:hypothetical protein